MGGRKKKGGRGNLRVVSTQCEATTRAGTRCKRKARKNGACEIKAHQDQLLGRNVVRREPAKHEAKCLACAHPDVQEVQAEWVMGALSDAEAGQRLEISDRSWQRHAHYKDLYGERARKGLLPYLSRIMDASMKGDPKMASGVAAARLAHTIVQGGEKIRIELYNQLQEDERGRFFKALEKLLEVEEEMTPAQFIALLQQHLAPPAPETEGDGGRVH